MGSLDPHPYPVALSELCAGAEAIVLVRPDGEVELEEREASGPEGSVRYAWGWEPHVVLSWLKSPANALPRLWIAAASSRDAARDAQDRANGLFGHVHHVVPVPVLTDVDPAWLRTTGERIVFLRSLPGGRWESLHAEIALGPEASERVAALLRPAPEPRRRWWPW